MPRRPAQIETLATAAATGEDLYKAAARLGVGRRVVTRYRDRIQRRADEIRQDLARHALSLLSGSLVDAVTTLRDVITDERTTPAGKLRAANSLIAQYQAMQGRLEIEQQIREIQEELRRERGSRP